MVCFPSQEGRASIQIYLSSGRTQTHKLSGREAVEDAEALQQPDLGSNSNSAASLPSVSRLQSLKASVHFSVNGDAKSTLCYPG